MLDILGTILITVAIGLLFVFGYYFFQLGNEYGEEEFKNNIGCKALASFLITIACAMVFTFTYELKRVPKALIRGDIQFRVEQTLNSEGQVIQTDTIYYRKIK